MNRTTLLVFCLTAALFAGCTGKKHFLAGATVLAYWSDVDTAGGGGDALGVRCDDGLDCVALRDNLLDFEEEVQKRRSGDPRMELVRFDAYRTDEGTALAGVWAKSDTQHDFEPVLDVAQFETEHADRSDSDHRQRLVHLAVWQDVSNFKVAAIWRHPPAGELSSEFWQPDIVLFGLTWSDLETAPAESYYLDDIEVYTVPIGGAPKVAAVWRPGALETEVLAGTHCHIGDEPLRSSQLNGNKDLPCEIEGSTTPSAMAKSSCPVLQQVYDIAKTAMDAGEKSFLRPFDFEKYVEGGETHLAVLLQKRENKDWLMLPGAWDAVDCRHTLFDLDDELGFSESRLLDLDLVGVEGHHFGDALHEGVVHDSGTSGPPGGS